MIILLLTHHVFITIYQRTCETRNETAADQNCYAEILTVILSVHLSYQVFRMEKTEGFRGRFSYSLGYEWLKVPLHSRHI